MFVYKYKHIRYYIANTGAVYISLKFALVCEWSTAMNINKPTHFLHGYLKPSQGNGRYQNTNG